MKIKYAGLLRELGDTREYNNDLWMELIAICFELAEKETKDIFREINKSDKVIAKLKNKRDFDYSEIINEARQNNNVLWMKLNKLSKELDPEKTVVIFEKMDSVAKEIAEIVDRLTK